MGVKHAGNDNNMKKIISGKVRDVYEIEGNKLVIVTTDRISAYDVVLSKPVSGKGKVLNAVSLFWFDYTKNIVPNHVISGDLSALPEFFQTDEFEGRAVLVKKLKMLPFEFIVRGFIFGNMWDAYIKKTPFCGHLIEGDYKLAQKLRAPIITPSTKAQEGHDIYISTDDVAETLGRELTEKINAVCLKLYEACYKYAYEKGIIIADTKFEFGLDENGALTLADEVFTPDSSRFWNLADYKEGESPKSYDKQFVRDYLTQNKVNGEMPFDNVPDGILAKTSDIYAECLRRITS